MEGPARLAGLIWTAGLLGYLLLTTTKPCLDPEWWSGIAVMLISPLSALLFTLPHVSIGRYYRYGIAAGLATWAGMTAAGFELTSSGECEVLAVTMLAVGWIPLTLSLMIGGFIPVLIILARRR